MRAIVIVVIIVVTIIFLTYTNKRLYGGEYRSASIGNETITPSVSQIDYEFADERTAIQLGTPLYRYAVDHAARKLERIGSYRWRNEEAKLHEMFYPKYMSDAHIDLMGFIDDGSVSKAMASCEWIGDDFTTKPSMFITVFLNRKVNVVSPNDNSIIQNFNSFMSNLSMENIKRDSATVYTKLESILKIIDSSRQPLNLSMLNEFAKDLNSISDVMSTPCIRQLLCFYSSSWESVSVDKNLSIDQKRKLYNIAFVKNMNEIKSSLETIKPSDSIDIYIEFSYETINDVSIVYRKVHLYTFEVIRWVLNKEEQEEVRNIYAFRFNLEENNFMKFKWRLTEPSVTIPSTNKGLSIYYYDECNFNTVQVPATQKAFSYDEGILLERKGKQFRIQIEHSEDGKLHKSNIVEFLARVSIPYISSIEELRTIFHKTSYLNKDDERFTINLMKGKNRTETIPLRKRRLYLSFGRFASGIFP